MPNYNISNTLGGTQQALSTSFKTLANIYAQTASLRRGKLYDLTVNADGVPADTEINFDVSRQTAAGTVTSVTPLPLDPADTAALSAAGANATVEPTITATSTLLAFGLNQRATFRWVAAPGSELVWPATNANGLAIRAKAAAYTSTAQADAMFSE